MMIKTELNDRCSKMSIDILYNVNITGEVISVGWKSSR